MSPNPIRDISQPDLKQLLEKLRSDYTRAQSQFAEVIQQMESELHRMRENDKIPQHLVDQRDLQIETLIKFNNRIEDLFNVYKLTNLNLQVELMATHHMLWEALKSESTAFEVLMHKLVKVPKLKSPQ